MHLYKTTVQILLVLSSLNLLLAAPIPRAIATDPSGGGGVPPHDTLLSEDGPSSGPAPSHLSAADGMPTGPTSAHPLSASSAEPMGVPESIREGSTTTDHPAETSVVPSNRGAKLKSYLPSAKTAKTTGKVAAGLALAAAAITGAIEFTKWLDKSTPDGVCPPASVCMQVDK
jgi:hypothetical protein